MEQTNKLGNAALIAGIAILIMVVTVPFAEFGIFPKLFSQNPEETARKLANNKTLFMTGIFLNFITIICDVIAAWALYVFLSPVNKLFSLLTAWFRLFFAAIYLVALFNLLQIVNLMNTVELFQSLEKSQAADLMIYYFHSFQNGWSFALILFGIYLGLLGFLAIKSSYVPNVFGVLLIIAGLGYFVDSIGKFLFPSENTEFLMITFLGELVFMLWLLIKGRKISPQT